MAKGVGSRSCGEGGETGRGEGKKEREKELFALEREKVRVCALRGCVN